MENKQYWIAERKRKRIKIKELCDYIKCSQALISRFEHGQLNISEEKYNLYKKFVKNFNI